MISEPKDKTENEKLWWEEIMDQFPFIIGIEPNIDPVVVYFIFGGTMLFANYWGTERPNTKEQIISYCEKMQKEINKVITKMIYGG